MITEQLDLWGVPSTPVDGHTAQVLALIDGDPLHERDRATIIDAILADGDTHDGHVDPNRVRPHLKNVYPRCIGATYQALVKAGVLTVDGWTVNADHDGRNAGRPARLYRLTHAHAP